jgi:hypothetical protein
VLTDLDAHITDVFPDVELATPGIQHPEKTYFTPYKGYPLMRCRIIQTFMTGTIQ